MTNLKDAILDVLERRRSELGDELQRVLYSCPLDAEQSYKDGYRDGFRDGYIELLEDLENLVKFDQLDE